MEEHFLFHEDADEQRDGVVDAELLEEGVQPDVEQRELELRGQRQVHRRCTNVEPSRVLQSAEGNGELLQFTEQLVLLESGVALPA